MSQHDGPGPTADGPAPRRDRPHDEAGPPDEAADGRTNRDGHEGRGGGRTALVLVLVVLVALTGAGLVVGTGRADSSLLFVGVPCLLAAGVGLPRVRGGWGTLVQLTTFVLLLVAALLQEAAVCVLIASPLVYGVAALAYGLSRLGRRDGRMLAGVPVLLLVSLEGIVPGARVDPEQTATAQRVVAPRCAQFEAALERGPRIDPEADRGRLLHVLRYPTPTRAGGEGLRPGDTQVLVLAGGEVHSHVESRTASSLRVVVDSDSSRLTRWVTVRSGTLTWTQEDDGCRARLDVAFERHLDPALYFGPVSGVFMDAGAAAWLAALD
ncbi:hypothetical protein [Phycicoccus flavus]|uniref:hypothetical protein n=1 Tax=Phycicoccus flavus TaxID=2502783 RepID=UPI000FEC20E1|nr:hypothetical protein [Phycicoccus flavus]NHA70020.1 hypothetical protein [Phycicoccus flavus]